MTYADFDHDVAIPPHSIESESSVIGGLLLENRSLDRVADLLGESDFYRLEHRVIYAAIASLVNASKPADVVTVFEHLQSQGKSDEAGGLSYLNSLAQYVPSAANIRRYAEIVREKAMCRALRSVGEKVIALSTDQGTPIESRIDQAQAELVGLLASGTSADEWVTAYDGLSLHTAVLEDRAAGKTTAMPTGLVDLDEYLEGGVRPGELVVIGARPSMGKTALAMTIGMNMAADYSAAMFSMEMPHNELRDRMTAMLGRVSLSCVKRPERGIEWDRVVDGVERARALKFVATTRSSLTINQLRSMARNVRRQRGLDVLLLDYIGLMDGLDTRQPRAYQLAEISRGLKTLATELGIAVICLAQVNRKVEERADATPSLSDLRDSGAIEQDADVVLFVHRPIQAKPDLGPEFRHFAKLSIQKNRNGRCGVLSLHYQGDQTRFDSWHGEPPTQRQATRTKQFED